MDSAWVRWRGYLRWRPPFLASRRDTDRIIDGERGPTDTDKLRELLFLQADEARAAGTRNGGLGLGLLQMKAAAAEQSQQTDND